MTGGGDRKRDEGCTNDAKQELNLSISGTILSGRCSQCFHGPPWGGIEALLRYGDFEHRLETIFVIQVWTQGPHNIMGYKF